MYGQVAWTGDGVPEGRGQAVLFPVPPEKKGFDSFLK